MLRRVLPLLLVTLATSAALSLVACSDEATPAAVANEGVAGAAGAAGSSSSQGGAGSGAVASKQDASVRFAARVGGQTFGCDKQLVDVGTSKKTVAPLDFRFYVHDVRLVDGVGTEHVVTLTNDEKWQSDGLALLDFEDGSGTCENGTAALNDRVVGTVDAGDFTRVRFKLGVPFERNHGDAALAPSPLNVSSLFWSWNGGYKFARLDFSVVGEKAPDGGPASFVFHLGSTGCVGEPGAGGVTSCDKPNLPSFDLPLPGAVAGDLGGHLIVLDAAALLADVDVAKDAGGMPGCMSGPDDPECASLFARIGLDVATGAASPTAAAQTTFRVE
jgi:uncharacterized repeat protein (TIGR04052 family)